MTHSDKDLKIYSRNDQIKIFTGEIIDIKADVFVIKNNIKNKNYKFVFDLDAHLNIFLKDFVVSMLADRQESKFTLQNIFKKYKNFKKLMYFCYQNELDFFSLDVVSINTFISNSNISRKNLLISDIEFVFNYFVSSYDNFSFLCPLILLLEDSYDSKYNDTVALGCMEDLFVSRFISLLVERFENADNLEKIKISLILIQTQIGLRSNEICFINSQMPEKTSVDGCYLIKYYSSKVSTRKNEYWGETILNSFAYKYFMYAYTYNDQFIKSKFLFGCLGSNILNKINDYLKRICITYSKELGTLNNSKNTHGLYFDRALKISIDLNVNNNFKTDDYIYYPTLGRFRNYRFNFLYKNGVPKQVIDKTVSHDEETKIDEAHYIDSSKNYIDSNLDVYYGHYSINYFKNLLDKIMMIRNIKKFDSNYFDYGSLPIINKSYGFCIRFSENEQCDNIERNVAYDEKTYKFNQINCFHKTNNLINSIIKKEKDNETK